MSTTNVYFTQGARGEQLLIEDLIIESLKIYGQEVKYIPRTLVSKDEILGEDRLSKFKSAFPIEMYFENVDNYEGQGMFIQKFGLMIEQSATLVVARRRWEQLVGRYGQTIIPHRPNEGDLIYFPLTKALFEIKFVKHQDPFYQLGKLYVYKLQIELFQYASEAIDTGVPEIDAFETLKTYNTNTTRNPNGGVIDITIDNSGSGYNVAPTISFVSSTGRGAAATAYLGSGVNAGKVVKIIVNNPGSGYQTAPLVHFSGGVPSTPALATAIIDANVDIPESYGDNNKFKVQAADVLFNASNPFGDVEVTPTPVAPPIVVNHLTTDSTVYSSDESITTDTSN